MPGRSALCFVSLVAALGALACGDSGTDLGAGEACVRTAQCGDGLACVEGRCTNDVSGIGGTVPDAGAATDGAVVVMDGGDVDGAVPMDAGGGVDSGPVEIDAGPPDAGPSVTDAGTDAGPSGTDAGPATDAG